VVFGPELRSNTKTNVAGAINQVRTNIENNRDSLINLIDTKAKSTVTNNPEENLNRQAFQQRTNERGFAGGRAP
jgi:hypothetical protein